MMVMSSGFVRRILFVGVVLSGLWSSGCERNASKDESSDVEVEAALTVGAEPPAGTFVGAQRIRLVAREGAEIHYTLDGTVPTLSSPVYRDPIEITDSVRLYAVAYEFEVPGTSTGSTRGQPLVPAGDGNGGNGGSGGTGDETVAGAGAGGGLGASSSRSVRRQSPVLGASYLSISEEVGRFTSHLPVLIIQTQNAQPIDIWSNEFVPATMLAFEPKQGKSVPLGASSLDTRMGIHVRGELAREQDKLKYTVEFWANHVDADFARPFLGMPADSDWVLLDPIDADRSLIRNALASELSNRMHRYAPRTKFAEVYLSSHAGPVTSDDFLGFYTVMEKIKRGKDRVDVEKLDSADVTGGYVLRYDKGTVDFEAADYKWQFVYPDAEDMTTAERKPHLEYLKTYLDEFGDALDAPEFKNPQTQKHYDEYIDVGSFIDHNIINAYMKNVDGLRFSSYFFKDRGGLLAAGPIWDFDRCAGALEEWRSTEPEEWFLAGTDGTDYFTFGLWGRLFRDPDFKARYIERFRALLAAELSEAQVFEVIDSLAAQVGDAAERNYVRWPDYRPFAKTHASEIERMKIFFSKRIGFIESELDRGLF
jgi:hypothetical protein